MSTDGLTSFLFSAPETATVFSPQAQLRGMTRFEWALSSALEANGLAEARSAAALEKFSGCGLCRYSITMVCWSGSSRSYSRSRSFASGSRPFLSTRPWSRCIRTAPAP